MMQIPMMERESPYQRRVRENGIADRNFLAGMYGAGLYIGLTILLTLPVMWLLGEGDYILVVISALYAMLFVYGRRKRRSAEKGTIQKSIGSWIAICSAIISVGSMILAFVFFQSGGWRYFG